MVLSFREILFSVADDEINPEDKTEIEYKDARSQDPVRGGHRAAEARYTVL